MEHPLITIRKEKGLTVTEMGILARVSTMTIQRIERGTVKNVTPDVLDILEKWGYDRNKIQTDYDKWKEYRIKQINEKVC